MMDMTLKRAWISPCTNSSYPKDENMCVCVYIYILWIHWHPPRHLPRFWFAGLFDWCGALFEQQMTSLFEGKMANPRTLQGNRFSSGTPRETKKQPLHEKDRGLAWGLLGDSNIIWEGTKQPQKKDPTRCLGQKGGQLKSETNDCGYTWFIVIVPLDRQSESSK